MHTGNNIVRLLGSLGVGVAIVTRDGHFGESNTIFCEIARGLNLKITSRSAFIKSLSAIATNTISENGVFIVELPSNGPRRLLAFDFISTTGEGNFEIVIAVDFSRNITPDPGFLAKLFDFTETETRMCMLLSQGRRLDEIAEELDLKLSTVRVYLKSIFDKTGAHRQQDLIILMWRSNLLSLGFLKTDQVKIRRTEKEGFA